MKPDLDTLKIRVGYAIHSLQEVVAELERLQRIEAAARAHLAEWESGDTMAHDTRKALKQALEG